MDRQGFIYYTHNKMQVKRDFGSRLLMFSARLWKEISIFAAT